MGSMVLKALFGGARSRPAAPGSIWQEPVTLDEPGVGQVCACMDHLGKGRLFWERGWTICALSHPAGSRSFAGRSTLNQGSSPCLAVNSRGKGVALWVERDASTPRTRILGQAFGVPGKPGARPLFEAPGPVRNLQVAVDRRGSALAVWDQEQDGGQQVQALAFDVRADTWQEGPATLGRPAGHFLAPRMGLNVDGRAMVLWQDLEGLLCCHYSLRDQTWSDRPVPVTGAPAGALALSMDERGNACALWIHPLAASRRMELRASHYHAASARWSEPVVLAAAQEIRSPRLVMPRSDELLAAWCHGEEGGGSRLLGKSWRKGTWESGVTRLDPGVGTVADFDLAQNGQGEALLLLLKQSPAGTQAQLRRFREGWSGPERLGDGAGQALGRPVLVASPRGALAAWVRGQGPEAALVVAGTL